MNKQDLRVLVSYYFSKKKDDIIKTVHICTVNNVSKIFDNEKRRGKTVIALAHGSTWCEGCIKTSCWDIGKAIVCNERVLEK